MNEPEAARRRNGAVPWSLVSVILAIIFGLGLGFLWSSGLVSRLQTQAASLAAEVEKLKQQNEQERQRYARFQQQTEELGSELERTIAERETARRALETARGELVQQLQAEIQRGDVFVRLRGSDLVVDVSDKVLFDPGEAEIKESGKEVLKQVARTLRRVPGSVFQVGGHTDSTAIVSKDVREKYPTNWELSAARAITVVRYLSEQQGVPGKQLVAAGFARFRPVASNRTQEGRARNRRIEIAVLREQKLPVEE
jgi:chemotaxis protein MotB